MKLVFDSTDELIRYVANETAREGNVSTHKTDSDIADAVYERLNGMCQIVVSVKSNGCPPSEPDRTYGPFRVGDRVALLNHITRKIDLSYGERNYGSIVNVNDAVADVLWDCNETTHRHSVYHLILTPDK